MLRIWTATQKALVSTITGVIGIKKVILDFLERLGICI